MTELIYAMIRYFLIGERERERETKKNPLIYKEGLKKRKRTIHLINATCMYEAIVEG